MSDYALIYGSNYVLRTRDQVTIPDAPGNRDWDEYQRWLADGGVPDPAKVPMPSPDWSWAPRFIDVIGRN